MGAFYANTVTTAPRDRVIEVLRGENLRGWVAPEAEDCTVFSETLSDGGDRGAIERIGARLSVRLRAPCLTALDADGGLWLWLFAHGLLRTFAAMPARALGGETPPAEPPQAVAAALSRAFGRRNAEAQLARVLAASSLPLLGYPHARDRHAALMRVLGLPAAIAGYGHRRCETGDISPPELLEASTRV
jgi:hypothetical protein